MSSDNQAPGLSTVTVLFFIWSVLTFAVRAWVKLRRSENWGLDDSTITAALLLALCHVISVFWAINAGYGTPYAELSVSSSDKIDKAFYASHYLYIVSIGLSKISTAYFIGHLTRHGPQVKKAYVLAALCGTWTVASLFVIGIRGNVSQPWLTVDGSVSMFHRWIGIESSGAMIEVALWVLSINIIWTLSMPLKKRLMILAIFGCRLLLIPLIVFRLLYLAPERNSDPYGPNKTSPILTEAVLNFAFISASITCLKPFLRPFHSSTMVSTVETGSSGWRSASRDPYYMLSTIGEEKDSTTTTSQDKDTALEKETRVEGEGEGERGRKSDKRVSYCEPIATTSKTGSRSRSKKFEKMNSNSGAHTSSKARQAFRPDQVESSAVVESTTSRRSVRRASPSSSKHSDKSNKSDAMVIHKTETWSVRVETEDEAGKGPVQRPSPVLKALDIGMAVSTQPE